jgi:DeoR family fructose operon transcriptional repressor
MNTANAGLAEERFRKIRACLKERGVVSVDELCEVLAVSGATIRRDLAELDARGHVRRVHGGAVCTESQLDEPVFDDKAKIAADEKHVIAELALKLVEPNDTIFLDGGSSVLALARLLTDMRKLTVVTNSLRVAGLLASAGPRMIIVGGELRRISQTFVGPLTRPTINQLNVDKAFMGTIGLKDGVMTTTDPAEAMTKEMVMEQARDVYLMADSSKLEKVSFVKCGELNASNSLITDPGISSKQMKLLKEKGTKVITKNKERKGK